MGAGRKRSRWWKWLLALALLCAAAYAGRRPCLQAVGEFLVRAEAPEKAEVAVVLAGDAYGHRIMRGVKLFRDGYVREVLVDGPRAAYDANEADLAIQFALRRGAPREALVALPMRARNTVIEARAIDAELRKRGIRKALVVTSDYHTRRARAVFRAWGSPGIRYVLVAAPDEDFTPGDWWRSREGQKIVFLEYSKLLYWWLIE